MSGIAGLCNLDGGPADPASLETMMRAIAHRGPDASGTWIEGPVALGHLMLHTTPESLRETQPMLHPEAGQCLTFDGRVDNREQLCATLGSRGYFLRTGTDAELVLQAYACWGENCAREILGDFAFAVWDARNRTLFCARDQIGIKPFYYTVDKRRFIFGSELQQLFAGTGIASEPNEGMIGEYLANAITSRDETLYRGIMRLPPAHCLSVRSGSVSIRRYWDADLSRVIRYRTDAEYAEHFMTEFKASVKCRLRSQTPISVDLSGGLDSSSIVSAVQILRSEGATQAVGVEAYSMVFPGMACDESSYIRDVVGKLGIESTLLAPPAPDVAWHEEYVRRHRDFPVFPGAHIDRPLIARARDGGSRVHLTGMGGDDWLTGMAPGYLELLAGCKFGELLHCAREDRSFRGIATRLRQEIGQCITSALAPASVRAIKLVLRRSGVPGWIDPDFARRVHLNERIQTLCGQRNISAPHQRMPYRWLNGGNLPYLLEILDRAPAAAGIESRHPFHDRRIVELAFALPREQLWREGKSKFVLREAMKGVLPESVRERRTKAEFTYFTAESFRVLGGEALCDELTSAPMQWVDKRFIRTKCQKLTRLCARGDEGFMQHFWPPWMAFGVDLWYKIAVGARYSQRDAPP